MEDEVLPSPGLAARELDAPQGLALRAPQLSHGAEGRPVLQAGGARGVVHLPGFDGRRDAPAQRAQIDRRSVGIPVAGLHARLRVEGPRLAVGPCSVDRRRALAGVVVELRPRRAPLYEGQGTRERDLLELHRYVAPQQSRRGQEHLHVPGSREDGGVLHLVVAEEGELGATQVDLPGGVRCAQSRGQQRSSGVGGGGRRTVGRLAVVRLEPMALVLPGIRRERRATSAGLDRGPVDGPAEHVERRQRRQHRPPFVLAPPEAREDRRGALPPSEGLPDGGRQDGVGADLHEQLAAALGERLDRLLEPHGVAHVAPPVGRVELGSPHGSGRDRGDERDLGVPGPQVPDRIEELLPDLLHLRPVVGHGDLQEASEDVTGGEVRRHPLQGVRVAGERDGGGSVDRGEGDLPVELVDHGLGFVGRDAGGEHASTPHGALLEPAAMVREVHRILDAQRARRTGGTDLSGAVADHRVGYDAPRPPQRRQAQLDGEVGHVCQPQLLGDARGGLVGEQLGQQRGAGERRQGRVGLEHGVAEHAPLVQELAPHLPPQGSHAGVDEGEARGASSGAADGEAGPRLVVQVRRQQPRHLGGVVRHRGQAVLVVCPPHRRRVAHVGEGRAVTGGEVAPEALGGEPQRRRGVGRQVQELGPAIRLLGASGRGGARRLLQDHVGVGPAESERVHPSDGRAGRLGPRLELRHHAKAQGVERDGGVGRREVEAGRDHASLEAEGYLDEARDPRAGLQVPDVGLHRTDETGGVLGAVGGEHVADGLRLRQIAGHRAGAVRFDVLHGAGRDPRVPQGAPQHGFLAGRAGQGQAAGSPVLVDGASQDHGMDPVPVLQCTLQALQHDHAGALPPHVAVRGGVERVAAAVGRQHPGLGEADGGLRREDHVDAADDRQLALIGHEAPAGEVDGGEGGRAGGVDRHAGAVEVQREGDPVGGDARRIAGVDVRVDVAPPAGGRLQVAVVVAGDADEDPRVGSRQPSGRLAGVLEGLPGDLEQEALLRIHAAGLARGDAEELGVEQVDPRQETAPARGELARRLGVRVEDRVDVEAVRRDLSDGVDAVSQQRPETRRAVGAAREAARHADDRDTGSPRAAHRTDVRGRDPVGVVLRRERAGLHRVSR